MFTLFTVCNSRVRAVFFGIALTGSMGRPAAAEKTEPLQSFCKARLPTDVEEIACSEDTVRDFLALRRFPRLRRLSVDSVALTAPGQLPALPALRSLDVSRAPIAELSGLEQMSALQELRADWTWVRELQPLGRLTELRRLSLANTPVEDLTPLRALAKLESIDLCNTRVRDLTPLSGLARLKEVRLCETPAETAPLLAKRPGLKLSRGAPPSNAEQPPLRLVTTEPGTELLNSLNERLGTQRRAAAWFASPQYDGAWRIHRRVGALFEAYHVKAAAMHDRAMHELAASWLVPPAPSVELTRAQTCQSQGLCNVELRAGSTLPAGALWTGVIAASDFKLSRAWHLCRRGEALEVQRPGDDWLAPAAGDLDRLGRLSLGPDDVIVTADGQPVQPTPCASATGYAARKTVLFSSAPAPIMGIFLLRAEDARALDKLQSSKARFEEAQKRAVKKWTYPDRFCDDAVHQAMLFLGDPTPEMSLAEAQKRYMSTIIARHNLMYWEYDRPGCERALERMFTAKQLAQQHGYRYYQFGY